LPVTKAGRRYIYRLAPMMAIYLVFLFIARWTFHHIHPTGLVVYFLAVLPALPLIGSLAIVGLYIAEESDDFERSIIVQSMLWGLGGALSVSTIWGSLKTSPTRLISPLFTSISSSGSSWDSLSHSFA
jgi:hypothetical protein